MKSRLGTQVAVLTGGLVLSLLAVGMPASAAAPDGPPAPCTRTETGAITGAQVVADGEFLCLKGATVTGAITVSPGGALLSRRSTVVGAITLSGAGLFTFCRSSTVGGAVSASGGTEMIRIGDNRHGKNNKCKPSTIDGAVTIEGNTGNVIVAHATITGAVTVDANAAASGVSTKLAANLISGDLSCAGNAPAPSNTGRPNTVTGVRSGQCAAVDF